MPQQGGQIRHKGPAGPVFVRRERDYSTLDGRGNPASVRQCQVQRPLLPQHPCHLHTHTVDPWAKKGRHHSEQASVWVTVPGASKLSLCFLAILSFLWPGWVLPYIMTATHLERRRKRPMFAFP